MSGFYWNRSVSSAPQLTKVTAWTEAIIIGLARTIAPARVDMSGFCEEGKPVRAWRAGKFLLA